MNILVFDPEGLHANLLPLTYTRPVGALRVGICTMAERWQALLPGEYSWLTEDYLAGLFPRRADECSALCVSGAVVATKAIAEAAAALKPGQALYSGDTIIARNGCEQSRVQFEGEVLAVQHVYDIFMLNDAVVRLDFDRITAGRTSAPVSATNTIIGPASQLFIEEGATVEGATINTAKGPVYVGRDAEIMEGVCMRGPVAMCEHSVANMGAKIYGATTLGPWCKVGGELNNVVMTGFSNKGHDGFLGNAVLGEWCNLGGGTTASNLKNDYSLVRLWNYPAGRFLRTGLQFCGLIMGDHSKSAVNTSFNTATVVGVGCNVVSEGMPRVFIPSFSKGGTAGFDDVPLAEFFTIAERVMARRHRTLTPEHRAVFEYIRDYSETLK